MQILAKKVALAQYSFLSSPTLPVSNIYEFPNNALIAELHFIVFSRFTSTTREYRNLLFLRQETMFRLKNVQILAL